MATIKDGKYGLSEREPWQEVRCQYSDKGVCVSNCAEGCICYKLIPLERK